MSDTRIEGLAEQIVEQCQNGASISDIVSILSAHIPAYAALRKENERLNKIVSGFNMATPIGEQGHACSCRFDAEGKQYAQCSQHESQLAALQGGATEAVGYIHHTLPPDADGAIGHVFYSDRQIAAGTSVYLHAQPAISAIPPGYAEKVRWGLFAALSCVLENSTAEEKAELLAIQGMKEFLTQELPDHIIDRPAKEIVAEALQALASAPLSSAPIAEQAKDAVVSAYRIGSGMEAINIERVQQIEGPDKWAVRRNGDVLNKSGNWEYEPLPSSRDDDFMKRCRFESHTEAIDAAMLAAPADSVEEGKL